MQNLSSLSSFTTTPPGKNDSGRDGRARLRSATPRARECTRRDFRLFSRVVDWWSLLARDLDGPPAFLRSLWTTDFHHHQQAHTKPKERKKTKEKTNKTRIKSERTLPSRRLDFSTLSPVSRSRVSSARNSFASSGRRLSRRRQQRRT